MRAAKSSIEYIKTAQGRDKGGDELIPPEQAGGELAPSPEDVPAI